LRAAHAGLSVHMYNFALLANPPAGSTHGAELGYVFGTRVGFTSQTQRVSDRVQGYWANFARTGDPNGGLLNWPEFSAANDLRMNFGLNSKIVTRFRSDECAFWRAHDDQAFAAAP
jgi:para-nitrobenzyl esterase